MAQVNHNGKIFSIPDAAQAQYPELIEMILATESMDDDERQYWFDIMPSMTDAQVDRLYNILDTERKKLDDLEKKYQTEIKQLNEKHLIEWQDFQMKSSKQKIASAEASDEEDDADNVLQMLNQI